MYDLVPCLLDSYNHSNSVVLVDPAKVKCNTSSEFSTSLVSPSEPSKINASPSKSKEPPSSVKRFEE